MFPSYRFVHCVQLSAVSTVFDTLIVGLYCSLVTDHLVYLIKCHTLIIKYFILYYDMDGFASFL